MARITAALLVAVPLAVCAAPLDSFLPPLPGGYAIGGEIGGPQIVASPDDCAVACLGQPSCISFSIQSSSVFGTCGIRGECYAPNASSCPSILGLSCYGGTFSKVDFASYGTPQTLPGTCTWQANATCDAPSTVDVISAACLGKSACAIEVSVATFGPDPCPGTYKFLAASLSGSCSPPPPNASFCQLNGYARNYTVSAGSSPEASAYYQRLQPRNDSRTGQAIPYLLEVPTGNVTLKPGVLLDAFNGGIEYLLNWYTVNDVLFDFRQRAGVPQPPGAHCHGWDCTTNWIEGSIAGLFLMGAGGHLRWVEQPQLRAMMNEIIDGIENCTEPDGYLAAFNQSRLGTDEHPDYTTSWTVHGFLEAAIAGNPKALRMIRAHMNVFNNHTLLPTFLPPDGGNWPYQEPAGPWPPGADNKTSTGNGPMTGHTIYLIDQGLIHQTRMALSPVGTQADIDLLTTIYEEPWWLEMLGDRNLEGIWHKVWYPHNYKVTAFEAYADAYVLTGNTVYLDAVLGAWEMLRDPLQGWIHVGGSLAINEGDYYPPGSFHIDYGTHAMENEDAQAVTLPRRRGARKRDWFRAERGRLAGEPEWLDADHDAHALAAHDHAPVGHHHHGDGTEWNGQFPTGEFCGAVFWLKLNQRFHRFWPDNETFVGEIEREVYNEGLTHQAPNGSGIRYFSNLNGIKETPGTIGTCCEGQGTRLYGSINEYLFSFSATGLYVDVYAPSSIAFTFAGSACTVDVTTAFPFDDAVLLSVTADPPIEFDLALRMPAWAGTAPIPIAVNGIPVAPGAPGSYAHIKQTWGPATAPTAVAFVLPRTLAVHPYTGVTPGTPGLSRIAYTVGPVLLAATSASRWNATAKTLIVPGVNGSDPGAWLTPAGDGNGLHYVVTGVSDVLFQPLWEVQGTTVFSSYPSFEVV